MGFYIHLQNLVSFWVLFSEFHTISMYELATGFCIQPQRLVPYKKNMRVCLKPLKGYAILIEKKNENVKKR